MTAAEKLALGLMALITTGTLARAADVRWQASGETEAVYTDNIYYETDDSATPPVAEAGYSAGLGFGLTSNTVRSEFALGYKANYRGYPQESEANNLEQYLALTWSTFLSQKTSFLLLETASFSPEVDNFEDRGVDQGLTVGTRARQFRNTTGLGFTTDLSPRWSFRMDYAYRLLNSGDIERPEDAPPPVADCNGGFCIPGSAEDTDGDGTIDEFEPTVEDLELLDERGHTASVGVSHNLTPFSDLTVSGTYLHLTTTDDLFGGSTIRRAHAYGANVIYAWRRVRSATVPEEEGREGPVDMATRPGAPETPPTPEEQAQAPPRRPSDEQPYAPLSAGSDERPRGGITSARVAARRAAGPNADRIFALPDSTIDIWFGVGVYQVTDTLGAQLTEILELEDPTEENTEYSGEIGIIRTYGRGALSAGLTHGVSTFEGLARREAVDTNEDGTVDTTVQVPAGPAMRTTLYGSYIFTLTPVSHFDISVNATRRKGISNREFDFESETEDVGQSEVTAVGAGIGYDLQFASWCGLRASYRYTVQNAPGTQLLSDLDYARQTATLGLFFTTR